MPTYELWSTDSNNLVDWWDTRTEALAALRQMPDLRGLRIAYRNRRGTTVWSPALDFAVIVGSQAPP